MLELWRLEIHCAAIAARGWEQGIWSRDSDASSRNSAPSTKVQKGDAAGTLIPGTDVPLPC